MKRGSSLQDEPHVAGFVACARSPKEPAATLEAGTSATLPPLLASISQRTGRLPARDAKASTIPGDAEAAGMLKRTYREPWWPPPSCSPWLIGSGLLFRTEVQDRWWVSLLR